MTRRGRKLEILVAKLESHLGDTGIQIRSPDYIVGRRSGSRREIDVTLRARIGSSNVLVIIECRDRDATEDVTWVEQLASKREDVGADKAVAVSAAGFTEGARNTAATYGIPLRTLQQVNLSEVRLWFPFQEFPSDKLCWNLHHIDLAVDKDALGSLRFDSSEQDRGQSSVPALFRARHTGLVASLEQHLWKDLPGPRIYEGVPSDGTRIERFVRIQVPDAQHRYQVKTASGFIDVMEIDLYTELWIERQQVPLVFVQSYEDQDGILARDAQFHVEHEGTKFVLSLSEYPDKGTQSVAFWGVR